MRDSRSVVTGSGERSLRMSVLSRNILPGAQERKESAASHWIIKMKILLKVVLYENSPNLDFF